MEKKIHVVTRKRENSRGYISINPIKKQIKYIGICIDTKTMEKIYVVKAMKILYEVKISYKVKTADKSKNNHKIKINYYYIH